MGEAAPGAARGRRQASPSPGPQGCWPRRVTWRPRPGRDSRAGPIADAPYRRRMSSTARLASSHEPTRRRVVEAELLAAPVDQARRAHAEQPYAGIDIDLLEQTATGLGQRRAARHRLLRGDRAGDGREVAVADLERDRAGHEALVATGGRPPRRPGGRAPPPAPPARCRSCGERLLVADRLQGPVRLDLPIVDGRRRGRGGGGRARCRRRRRATGAAPRPARRRWSRRGARSRARVAGPTPQSAETGSGWRNASSSPGATSTTPLPGVTPAPVTTGLAASEASLATSFDGATPTLQVSQSSSAMARRSARRSPRPARTAAARRSRRGRPRRGRSAPPAACSAGRWPWIWPLTSS